MLINLGMARTDTVYRELKESDTFRKPSSAKRALGDTYRNDGSVWTNTGVTAGVRAPSGSQVVTESVIASQGTRAAKRTVIFHVVTDISFEANFCDDRKGKEPLAGSQQKVQNRFRHCKEGKCTIIVLSYIGLLTHDATMKDGWIWSFGHTATGDVSSEDLQKWMDEGAVHQFIVLLPGPILT